MENILRRKREEEERLEKVRPLPLPRMRGEDGQVWLAAEDMKYYKEDHAK